MNRIKRGFTVVELLIVVVVIAILTTIVAIMYKTAQPQASDVQMRDALDKFADSMQLWGASRPSQLINGGFNSGATYDSATQNCTNPGIVVTRWQDAGMSAIDGANYRCTIGDVLVNTGYLPSDFFTKLPKNPKYPTSSLQHIMTYKCTSDATGRTYVVMASLESPTTDDDTEFASIYTSCWSAGAPNGGTDTQNVMQNTYNMRYAKKITL